MHLSSLSTKSSGPALLDNLTVVEPRFGMNSLAQQERNHGPTENRGVNTASRRLRRCSAGPALFRVSEGPEAQSGVNKGWQGNCDSFVLQVSMDGLNKSFR